MGMPLRPEEIRRQLETKRLGKTLHYFPEIDSTNRYACELARDGAPDGAVVIADAQTRGKGRLGRSWVSPACLNLYLSAILRPRLAAIHAPQLTLACAVAVAETVQQFIRDAAEIKWPNDILVRGKKLAGILAEASCEGDRILFVVVGIGINVNFSRNTMPVEIRETATSLMIVSGKPVEREAFARRLIQSLDQCYGDLEDSGFPSIASRWESFFHLRGKRVRIEVGEESILGKALGLDTDGALLIEDDQGFSRRIIAGDVIPLKRGF